MSTVTRPRGPLPARVYWTRRCLLLLLALLLVFGVSRLLGGGGTDPTARQVGAVASTSSAPTSAATTPAGPTPTAPASPAATGAATTGSTATATAGASETSTASSAEPLAQPTGPCSAEDIVASPSVKGTAYAGRSVVFRLALTTRQSPACTWTVSPRAVVVKVTSGSDRVWSTQQCRGAVPKQSVVVRQDHPATVAVAWNGQRSDADCTRSTSWAEPGFYHVVAAAFGSDPTDEQFQLLSPPVPTLTRTPKPEQKGLDHAGSGGSRKDQAPASSTPTATPSPAR
jgi:hypothetical protein